MPKLCEGQQVRKGMDYTVLGIGGLLLRLNY